MNKKKFILNIAFLISVLAIASFAFFSAVYYMIHYPDYNKENIFFIVATNFGFPFLATFFGGFAVYLLKIEKHVSGIKSSVDYNTGLIFYDAGKYEEAFAIWKKVAKKGDADAENAIGFIYGEGKLGNKDYKQAIKWFRKSAKNGNGIALYNIGELYRDGNGVLQNNKLSYMWYYISKMNGIISSEEELKKLEKKMSIEDIEEAKKLAYKCIKSKYKDCGE